MIQRTLTAILRSPAPCFGWVQLPRGYSSKLQRLLNTLLSKDPENRPNINTLLGEKMLRKRIKSYLDDNEFDGPAGIGFWWFGGASRMGVGEGVLGL